MSPQSLLAATPPMGRNSWEAFRREVSDDGIKAQADLMVSTGLLDAGYNYLVIDGGWKPGSRAPNGDLIADPQKFPHGAAIVRLCSASVPSRGLGCGRSRSRTFTGASTT
jgi:alpha-galactosidase